MGRKLFGTDGIRGVANSVLTPEMAFALGTAVGRKLKEEHARPRVVIGRDTRISGPMLGAALASGLNTVGVNVTAMGVVPTGGISYVVRECGYQLGIVISASHNPAPDNGIKLLGHHGGKVSDEFELEVEKLMEQPATKRPTGAEVGYLDANRDELMRYTAFLESLVPERLEQRVVAIDASHGAAYQVAASVLRRLGANVFESGVHPDGMNINAEGGATKPQAIQALTLERKADFGIAFDGDADRAIFCDSKGRLINGDRAMALWAKHWAGTPRFANPTVVGTVMSNGGFEHYLGQQGIQLERAPVGDKYVKQRMDEVNACIGGEQSGHIIFSEHAPTGDGLITALEILRVLQRGVRPSYHFYDEFENWPQLLINVAVERKDGWEKNEKIAQAVKSAEQELGATGRINLRASGTQPMLRVMVESQDREQAEAIAERMTDLLLAELGGKIYSEVDLTHGLGD